MNKEIFKHRLRFLWYFTSVIALAWIAFETSHGVYLLFMGVILGFVATSAYMFKNFDLKPKYPYRWKCTACGFEVAGSDAVGVVTITESHQELHTSDF